MRSIVLVSIVTALASGCGDGGDGKRVSAEVAAICTTQCRKAGECGLLEGEDISRGECQSACEQVNSVLTKDCMFTSSEADACGSAYAAQTCDESNDAVLPDACVKTCMVTATQ